MLTRQRGRGPRSDRLCARKR